MVDSLGSAAGFVFIGLELSTQVLASALGRFLLLTPTNFLVVVLLVAPLVLLLGLAAKQGAEP